MPSAFLAWKQLIRSESTLCLQCGGACRIVRSINLVRDAIELIDLSEKPETIPARLSARHSLIWDFAKVEDSPRSAQQPAHGFAA
jgi:hypothetical protein